MVLCLSFLKFFYNWHVGAVDVYVDTPSVYSETIECNTEIL
jgi:hypothetical protein